MAGATRARAMTMRRWFPAWALSFLLAACGGGGGGGARLGPSGTLPAALVVSAPTTQQALGATVSFSANASSPTSAISGTSATAAPAPRSRRRHVYARAGVFTVRLTLGNGGGSITGSTSVAVADFAIVAGKTCNRGGNNGWCWQRPLPQGNFILDYAFVDDNRGWAVGQGGAIARHRRRRRHLERAALGNDARHRPGGLSERHRRLADQRVRRAAAHRRRRRELAARQLRPQRLRARRSAPATPTPPGSRPRSAPASSPATAGSSWRQLSRRPAAPSGSRSPAPPTSGRCRPSSTRSRPSAIRSTAARPGRR